ncbi:MAG TPA: phage tail tape measure protein, partial [Bacteroidales bacterium]|nr:phage tail tape measure protein [Bacteroidales bacterium]
KNIKGSTTKSRSHLKKLQDRFKKMGGGALALGKKIGQLALKFGALAAAAVGGFGIGKSLSEFAKFESAVTDMGKVTSESYDVIREKMLAMPSVLGDATSMTKGYYATISAGVTEPVAAMDLLTTAAKASKASHTELAGTIEGMTKMMAGFEGKIKSATDASDLLFAIEKEGQTTFSQLIPVIGTVSKLSSDLGINQQEMAGSLALVTQTAANTSEAATHYRATLIALMKPTEAMKTTLKDMGFASSQAAIKSLGLSGTLKMLKDLTGGSADKMAELFGRQEALIGVSELSANNFENLNQKIKVMGDATGSTDKAFEKYKTTLSAVWDTAKNTISKQMILIGEKLAPQIKVVLGLLTTWLDKNNELIANQIGVWIDNVATAASKLNTQLAPLTPVIEGIKFAWDIFMGALKANWWVLEKTSQLLSLILPKATPKYTPLSFYESSPGYAHGTDFVPQTGLYKLHRGEEVKRPQEANQAANNNSFGDVNIYIPEGSAPQSAEDYRHIVRDFIIPELQQAGRL